MFTAKDRLVLLDALGTTVRLTADGAHLDVAGPVAVVGAAEPMLRANKTAFLAELRAQDHQSGAFVQPVVPKAVANLVCPKCART